MHLFYFVSDNFAMKIQGRNPMTANFATAIQPEFNEVHKTAYYTECAALCFNMAGCVSFKYSDKGNLVLNECHMWKNSP